MSKMAFTLLTSLSLAMGAQATLISMTADKRSSSFGSGWTAANLVSGVEMNNTGDVNDWEQYTMSPGPDNLSTGVGWMSNNDPQPWVILDLGADYNLDTISVWNFNPGVNAFVSWSAQDIDVYLRSTADSQNIDGDKSEFDATGWSLVSGISLSQNPSGTTVNSPNGVLDNLSMSGRYLAIDVRTNYANNGFVPLSEVQAFGVAVPEPSTLGLFTLFGAAILLMRRRIRT